MLNLLDFDFSVIGLTETKLRKGISSIPISIKGYNFEHTPTESSCGGALLYISEKLHYKPRDDLLIYKPSLLESVFVEILSPEKSNIIVGCIYRHPSMSLSEFNDSYLAPLLSKISLENKTVLLLGDFNVDLIKCNIDSNTTNYFDLVSSHNFLPYVTLPTRITAKSRTLIDNIFSNCTNPHIRSGNLTSTISDHLPQFFIYPNMNKKCIPRKHNIYKRNVNDYDKKQFLADFLKVN